MQSKARAALSFAPDERERFAAELLAAATDALSDSAPQHSARRLLSPRASLALMLIATACLIFALAAPAAFFVAASAVACVYFLIATAFRALLAVIGLCARRRPAAPPLPDAALPCVTILLPVHDEAEGLPLLDAAIAAIDYPRDKLDIKLLLEADDARTIAAARRLGLDRKFDCVIVPAAAPRTKPKACNYGMYLARGELIVIYDAEDAPEPDQLRKAAAAFAAGDDRLACLQARLNYYNAHDALLTRLFALEYAVWFDLFLPALSRLGAPIPLGGTSNIFRTATLRAIGGWDPFNVAEDADLGLRLARLGYRTAVLDSTTFEEAACRLPDWIRQRSRWMKGHMQTFAVHARRPRQFVSACGVSGLLCLHLFVAGNFLSAFANPLLLLLGAAHFGAGADTPAWLVAMSLIAFAAGNAFVVLVAFAAAARRGWMGLAPFAAAYPLYWLLSSVAAARALLQLATSPHRWEKTAHVVSRAAKARLALTLRRSDAATRSPLQNATFF